VSPIPLSPSSVQGFGALLQRGAQPVTGFNRLQPHVARLPPPPLSRLSLHLKRSGCRVQTRSSAPATWIHRESTATSSGSEDRTGATHYFDLG